MLTHCQAVFRMRGCPVHAPGCAPHPPVDVYERDGELVIVAQVPGRRLEEFDLELHGETLSLSCPGSPGAGECGRRILEERRKGGFVRIIRLPSGIDADRVSARLADGFLRIHVPVKPGTTVEWIEEDSQPGSGTGAPGRAGMTEQSQEGNSRG